MSDKEKIGVELISPTETPAKLRVLCHWQGAGPSVLNVTTELLNNNQITVRFKDWGWEKPKGDNRTLEELIGEWLAQSNIVNPIPCEIFSISDEFGPDDYSDPEVNTTHKHPKFFRLLKKFIYPQLVENFEESMLRFKIRFAEVYDDLEYSGRDISVSDPETRVVVAENIELAKQIAQAMVGECVSSKQYLNRVVSVEPTEKKPNVQSWDTRDTWQRVLERMNLTEYEIKFICYKEHVVGFSKKFFEKFPEKFIVYITAIYEPQKNEKNQWSQQFSKAYWRVELTDEDNEILRFQDHLLFTSEDAEKDEKNIQIILEWLSNSNIYKPIPCKIFRINRSNGGSTKGPYDFKDPLADITRKTQISNLFKKFVYIK